MVLSGEDKASLERTLADFEAFRKKKYTSFTWYKRLTKPFKIVYYIAVPAMVVGAILPFLMPFFLPVILIGIAFFITQSLLYSFVFKSPDAKFENKFKTEIMPLVFEKINPDLKYSPFDCIPQERVERLLLFKNKISSYYGEDLVVGKFNGVKMRFCEATLRTKKYSAGTIAKGFISNILDDGDAYDDGGGDEFSKQVVFFEGLLMEVDFHKAFKGKVIAIPQRHINSKFFKQANFEGQQKAETGNTVFDQQYAVFTNDEVMLHYILTPALLEKFIKLGDELEAEIFLSFINGRMNMGVNWNRNLFECDFAKGIPSIEAFVTLSEEITLFEEIVTTLSQERRIWGEKALIN